MGASYVVMQQACLHSEQLAQSAVMACQDSLAIAKTTIDQLEHLAKNTENHVPHVIAVFSELALGVSSVELFDPLKWRERANKISSDAIGRDELLSSVKRWGKMPYFLIQLATSPRWKWTKFYFFPIVSITLACIALFGMVFHLRENWLLFSAILSFLVSVILPIILTTGIREEYQVDQARKVTIK